MNETTSDRILKYLSGPSYRPQKVRTLARSLGVDDDEYAEFRSAVKTLMKSGRVVLGRGNAVMLPHGLGEMIGTYRANPRGFGFVVPESPDTHGDLYVPRGESLGAVTGDTVRAKILKKGRRGERGDRMLFEGRIVEIVARGNNQFVGQLVNEHGGWYVWPDGNTLNAPVEIADVAAKNAKVGDQVVIELTEYPKGTRPARGVIVKRLGVRGESGVAVQSILHQYHLPAEFPAEVLDEARRVVRSFDPERAASERDDLRELLTVTIDPDDARDYDDAISLRRVGRGGWELGVHIADVSAFIAPGGAIDREAYERGNSVYFPGYVVPMLPEVLSNGLCSLQEGEPRLVKSAFIRIDASGRPAETRFANAIIRSSKRLTYGQATDILEGRVGGFEPAVVQALQDMEKLARLIRKRRLADGMLVLSLPEIELKLDDDGNVIGAEPADTSFSHTLIEMFMVEANEAVARQLTKLALPFLRRIHPAPDSDSGERLTSYLRLMGHRLSESPGRSELQKLLDATRGRPDAFAVHMAVLRSLEKAVYSPKDEEHYALASDNYCHFTSPIRRYPDLTVHRLLDGFLTGQLKRRDRVGVMSKTDLFAMGAHCSFTERRAEDAERELRKVLVLHHLERHVGDEFDGVVTGVANIGVFVQLSEFGIDGLIRFENLPDDWWELDARAGMLIGQRSQRRIRIGDRLRVAISSIGISSRELNLSLVGQTGGARTDRAPSRGAPRLAASAKRRPAVGRPAPGRRAKRSGPANRTGRRGRGRGR